MNENLDKNLIEVEECIQKELDSIPLESFDELMVELRPKLKKKRKPSGFISKPTLHRLIAVVASIVLIVGLSLTAYFVWFSNTPPATPQHRYEDDDITPTPCGKNDVLSQPDIFVPNIDILLEPNIVYIAGIHNETQKPVYYKIEGSHMDNGIVRYISLTIILEKKYAAKKEADYNSNDKIIVSDIEISILDEQIITGYFYNYKVGFKVGDVRYYMNYQTTSETNDIESFMLLFL